MKSFIVWLGCTFNTVWGSLSSAAGGFWENSVCHSDILKCRKLPPSRISKWPHTAEPEKRWNATEEECGIFCLPWLVWHFRLQAYCEYLRWIFACLGTSFFIIPLNYLSSYRYSRSLLSRANWKFSYSLTVCFTSKCLFHFQLPRIC